MRRPSRSMLLLVALLVQQHVVGSRPVWDESQAAIRDAGTARRVAPPRPSYLPVVLWHGMGDSAFSQRSMGAVQAVIEETLPGVVVHSIATGSSETRDIWSTYFGNLNTQVEKVCAELLEMEVLKGGFLAMGFSQGGQFLRAVVQRCQHLLPGKMHSLVTLGAQHQGIMETPGCLTPSKTVTPSLACRAMQAVLGWGAYLPFVQSHVIQAQYFKDPYHLMHYLSSSIFLADINLETPAAPAPAGPTTTSSATVRSSLYRDNLASLQRLVLYQFEDDDMVVPRESSLFGEFSAQQGRVLALNETKLYQEDRLGLKALQESGRLVLATVPGLHMQVKLSWLADEIVKPYLAVEVNASSSSSSSSRSHLSQAQ